MSKKLQIQELDPNSLVPNAWNTNVVSPDNERKLTESLKRFGFFKPILARVTPDGELEVIGGEHRWMAAKTLGYATVPVVNLGPLDDKTAKEISLVDNGRYGNDDALQLAELLSELGNVDDLTSFMPYESADMEKLFSAVTVALDDLELDEADEQPAPAAATKPKQEFQVMRFKVPIDDVRTIQNLIEQIMKEQKLNDKDSMLNAGMALVHLIQNSK